MTTREEFRQFMIRFGRIAAMAHLGGALGLLTRSPDAAPAPFHWYSLLGLAIVYAWMVHDLKRMRR